MELLHSRAPLVQLPLAERKDHAAVEGIEKTNAALTRRPKRHFLELIYIVNANQTKDEIFI